VRFLSRRCGVRSAITSWRSVGLLAISIAFAPACAGPAASKCGAPPPPRTDGRGETSSGIIGLADWLKAGRLRIVNRDVAAIRGGEAVRVTARPGVGLIWLQDTDFREGTIDADVCGRDVDSQSFVGIAFHRNDDRTYEAVYLRPFNFRAGSPDRRNHAVQYIAEPDYDYARLRQKFPTEFEHAVDPSLAPTAWTHIRIVVRNSRVRVFVGPGDTAALDLRELSSGGGQVGLFVDNGSDGGFANLRLIHGS
jgi:hypothetical protein